MDIIGNLAVGLESILLPQYLWWCFVGVFVGMLVGVLPGIGSLAAISILMPVSFHLDPTAAIVLLAGVYYGAEYGGSTASILLNLPGTPSSAVTCIDGYPMAKEGRAGIALFTTTIASFAGCMFGVVALIAFAPGVSRLAMAFGPAEYFALVVVGLLAAATVSQGSSVKGVVMVLVGLVLGTVGTDLTSGVRRFTFGELDLYEGVNLIALAMGVFGVSEVISSIRHSSERQFRGKITFRSMVPTRDDARRSVMPILRGGGVGGFLGVLPGAGQTLASFASYAVEKRVAKDPHRFGRGAIEGVAGPETANNASVQAAFIPTLTLGIPGSATMALMMGALLIHGITPGPSLITGHPDLFWGLIASFIIGNLMLLILNIPLIGIWLRLLQVPYAILYPCIIVFICIGVYGVNNSLFDIMAVAVFGLAGYGLRLLDFEPAPLLIGFVLGPMLEENFRRAMILAQGDVLLIVQRPVVLGIFAATAFVVLAAYLAKNMDKFRRARGT